MKKIISLLLFAGLVMASCNEQKTESNENKDQSQNVDPYTGDKMVIAYVAGWNEYKAEDIAAEKLTHINYAFGNVYDGKVMEGDSIEVRDEARKRDSANYAILRSLKTRNPDLKIIGSIGGWTWSGGFSDAVLTDSSIEVFTQSALAYVERYDLDGIDFDWEYPCLPGMNNTHRPEDRENFVAMLKSVREALDARGKEEGKHYITSIASGGFDAFVDTNDLAEVQKHLDYINIMTYDFHGGWDSTTAHHTNLYSDKKGELSAQRAVEEHIAGGVPIEKLVMGIAFYGRSWKGVNPENNGLYQVAKTGGEGFDYKKVDSILNSESNFVRLWDEGAKAPYLWSAVDSTFVTYDDPKSITAKCAFIKEKGMAGAMFWEYSEDNGDLLQAINDGLE